MVFYSTSGYVNPKMAFSRIHKRIGNLENYNKGLEKDGSSSSDILTKFSNSGVKSPIRHRKALMKSGSGIVITASLCLLAALLVAFIILFVRGHIKARAKSGSSKGSKGNKRKSKHRLSYVEDEGDDDKCKETKYYPHQMGGKLAGGKVGKPNGARSSLTNSLQGTNLQKDYHATAGSSAVPQKSKKMCIDWYKSKKPEELMLAKKGVRRGIGSNGSKHSMPHHNDDLPRALSIKSIGGMPSEATTPPLPNTPLMGSSTVGGILMGIGYGIGGGGSYLHQFFPAYGKDVSENLENGILAAEALATNPELEVEGKGESLEGKKNLDGVTTGPDSKTWLPKCLTKHMQGLQGSQPSTDDGHSHSQEEMLLSRKGENGASPSQPNSPLSKPPVGLNAGKQTPTGQAKSVNDTLRLNDLYNSGAGEEEDHINLGTIHFGVSYDFQNQNLVVKILQAKTLPAKDITGTSDPYVKLFLLPDRKSKMETRVKKKCLNPIWNETFLYEGFPYHKLQNRILNLQVYDYDRFSKDDPIGEIFLPLNEVDLSQFPHYWKKLIPMDKASKTGEILLTITYVPGPGKLIIEIIKCKNLKPTDVIGSSDPYIKLWLMEGGKKVEKQKTQIKFNNLNPIYNESFTFMVPTEKIRSTSILVSALDYDRFTRNDTIGSFLLSSRSSPMEMKHWKDMLLNPGKPITQWHFLRT